MNSNHRREKAFVFKQSSLVSYLKIKYIGTDGIKLRTSRTNLFFKRCFDIIVSLLVIVFILSWMLPILALLIKLSSKGPVFFIQKRIGAFGKPFNCLKLRTMYVNAEANTHQAQTDDPRITSIGKLLRVSCFDELPQFFNVLSGEMSVVGPRPHMINDCQEFSKVIKDYHYRCSVKPGITGMAQVKGYRGLTNNFFDVSHRWKWDMFYVKNLSFKLDMRIIKLTIGSIISVLFTALFVANKKKAETIEYDFKACEYLN
jgi:putative colanic acid biosynthesis UDP-glucose lipid carrier transferase